MKRTILFLNMLLFLILITNKASAQVIWTDDFESYVVDSVIAPQSSQWVLQRGVGNSAMVSADTAASGFQSLKIWEGRPPGTIMPLSNVIHSFGDSTSGRYILKFKVFIPDSADAGAYWNIGHSMRTPNRILQNALRVHINAKGRISSLTSARKTYPFRVKYGKWTEVVHVFDLDRDSADFFYDGTLVVSHAFSNQDFSTLPGLNQLSAIELFAQCLSRVCSKLAYFDDFEFMQFPGQ